MLHAVILAGGRGERFWPHSRSDRPKHLLNIFGRKSILEETIERIAGLVALENIWVVTNREGLKAICSSLKPPLRKKIRFVIEPAGRNTAPAICLASLKIEAVDPGAVTIVLPSDAVVLNPHKFRRALLRAVKYAQAREVLLAVGIRPTSPITGYGYMKCKFGLRLHRVERFIEKPSLRRARGFLKSGAYLWNSGIFVWQVKAILDAFRRYAPGIYQGLAGDYRRLPNISIDYAIMEHARNIFAISGDFGWFDVGSWGTFEHLHFKDGEGNVVRGLHKGIDTKGAVVITGSGHLIGTVGISDLIIVHTKDSTLICHKSRAEDVRHLVSAIRADGRMGKYL